MVFWVEGYDSKLEDISKQSNMKLISIILELFQIRQGDVSLSLSGP